jgi:hypothetical protein
MPIAQYVASFKLNLEDRPWVFKILKEENYQFFSMYFQKKILAMNDMVLETESCILQIGTELKK